MAAAPNWDSIDVHLLRVLHALLIESSVSRAALKLNQSQPAVSAALRRLRDITGDQLLVRSRNGMTPTERGRALLEPVQVALAQIETIALRQVRFTPEQSRRVFNIATPDYLHAGLLGDLVSRLREQAPNAQVVFHSLSAEHDFCEALETGGYDVVIGNWPQPPEQLRLAPLFDDDLVCLMRKDHLLARRPLTSQVYLGAEHIVPTPYSVGRRGVIDLHLARERLKRNVVAQVPYFSLIPYMLLQTNMIFTGPRRFAEHAAKLLPLSIVDCPVNYPKMSFYLLWHERTHYSDECRWLREQIIAVTRRPDMRPRMEPVRAEMVA